jgi:hypothetical protein
VRPDGAPEHSHGETAICDDAGHSAFMLRDDSAEVVIVEGTSRFEDTRVGLQDDQAGPLIRSQ